MNSFAEVAQLDEATLRILLRGDSSTHRVWAAWALGMRDGKAMEHEARARIYKEPNPGVRRSLAVMLARDPDAMTALALDDPNAFVRVTAWRLISQVASTGRPCRARTALDVCGADRRLHGCRHGLLGAARAARVFLEARRRAALFGE